MSKEKLDKIRHKLRYPKLVLEMMAEEGMNRNNVPIKFIDDGIRAIKHIYRLINQMEKQSKK